MATYADMLDSDYGYKKALLKMGFETQISFMHNVNKALYTTMSLVSVPQDENITLLFTCKAAPFCTSEVLH